MLWVRFLLEEIKYLTFLFPRCGNMAKRCVEFRHSYSMPAEFGGKWETEVLVGMVCLNTRLACSLCPPCYVRDTM